MKDILRRPPSPPPGWQSVNPWTPRLALHVREITSVSVTFILTSTIPNHIEEPDPEDGRHRAGPSQPAASRISALSISDLLGKGLAVKVNNVPWQRVVMHIDDDADEEAIVILYGLMPARQYEIELGLVAGDETIRGKVMTEENSGMSSTPTYILGSNASIIDSEEIANETDLDEEAPILPGGQPLTPAATRPTTPTQPTAPRVLTVEEHASQLLNTLTTLDSEKESLIVRLKAARKESQRADAALRSEIEALKRASEKSAQSDQRSRQKVLALQEAVKRLLAASVEAEEQARLVEASLPQLEQRVRAVEAEHAKVVVEANKSKLEMDEAVKADRKRLSDLDSELGALVHRLDKLSHKRDKLATDTVSELEQQLADLGKQIEQVERSDTINPSPSGLQDLKDFDHEVHYPHHYIIPPPQPIPLPTHSSFQSHHNTTLNRSMQPIGRPPPNSISQFSSPVRPPTSTTPPTSSPNRLPYPSAPPPASVQFPELGSLNKPAPFGFSTNNPQILRRSTPPLAAKHSSTNSSSNVSPTSTRRPF